MAVSGVARPGDGDGNRSAAASTDCGYQRCPHLFACAPASQRGVRDGGQRSRGGHTAALLADAPKQSCRPMCSSRTIIWCRCAMHLFRSRQGSPQRSRPGASQFHCSPHHPAAGWLAPRGFVSCCRSPVCLTCTVCMVVHAVNFCGRLLCASHAEGYASMSLLYWLETACSQMLVVCKCW